MPLASTIRLQMNRVIPRCGLADSRTQLRVATGRKVDAGSVAPNKPAWQSSDPERVPGQGRISGRTA